MNLEKIDRLIASCENGVARVTREDLVALRAALVQQQEAVPADCDVRKIMLRVDPGEDGQGVEVYARNVGDVDALLRDLGGKVEEAYASHAQGQASAKELAKDLSRPMVDITPPASLRDRDMYEQGRLAERDPRTPGSLASQLALPAGPVPEGYKLVPVEPRPECCDEGKDGSEVCCGNGVCAYLQEVERARTSAEAVLASLPPSPGVAQPMTKVSKATLDQKGN